MILPIYTYGTAVLRKVAEPIDKDYPGLKELISNMYETMYHADGVGLAAPQIGKAIRLLIIDLAPFKEDDPELGSFKITMINPEMLEFGDSKVPAEEGCLSIPGIYESVMRSESIKIKYFDEDFNKKIEVYDGLIARVIQHEYDHIEGILFTDHISSLKKKLCAKKLQNIMDGKARPDYKMKFVNKRAR